MITDEEMRLAIEVVMASLKANWELQGGKVSLYVGHEKSYLGTLAEVYRSATQDRYRFETLIRAKKFVLGRKVKRYATRVAQETSDRYEEQVRRTSRVEVLAMLNRIIQDAPEPENWTEQQFKDMDAISFVMSWISYHTKE